MQSTAVPGAQPGSNVPTGRVVVIPAQRHTKASLRAMLDRIANPDSRRFAAAHLQVRLHVHLCDTWLGPAGWCMREKQHPGGCLPLPASYDPQGVAS
jgi:hypothetical protein